MNENGILTAQEIIRIELLAASDYAAELRIVLKTDDHKIVAKTVNLFVKETISINENQEGGSMEIIGTWS